MVGADYAKRLHHKVKSLWKVQGSCQFKMTAPLSLTATCEGTNTESY